MAQKKGSEAEPVAQGLEPTERGDVLELDEAWSFVGRRANKRWLWVALCRRTRQVVAFTIGDRTARTAAKLWGKIPDEYKRKQSFSDFWKSYRLVFESDPTHEQVPKESGELARVERFFATLRQRLARYVRQTLSFSKSERMHHLVTKLFIEAYNREVVT